MVNVLIDGEEIRDYRLMPAGGANDADVEAAARGRYLLTVRHERSGGALWVTVQNKDQPAFAAEIMLEINNGIPCLHIGNQHLGDNCVHVFVARDGVSMIGEDRHVPLVPVPASRFYPRDMHAPGALYPSDVEEESSVSHG